MSKEFSLIGIDHSNNGDSSIEITYRKREDGKLEVVSIKPYIVRSDENEELDS